MTQKRKRSLAWLLAASEKDNLCSSLDQSELDLLGDEVVREFDLDVTNRRDWDLLSEGAMKLAKQVKEAKNFPFEGSSNVKHPLITVSCIQFAARAYPEIVKGTTVVKCHITGDDFRPRKPAQPQLSLPAPTQQPEGGGAGLVPPGVPPGAGTPVDQNQMLMMAAAGQQPPTQPVEPPRNLKRERANRVSLHMNYQLLVEDSTWDSETDRLLHILPVLGQCFRKTYYSGLKDRNISELVLPEDCYVNKKAKTLETARRITHRLWFYGNDIWEKTATKLWKEVDNLGTPEDADTYDSDAPHEFLEQHCYKDLDGDGYKEPYVITVHRQTRQVVRIAARWQFDGVKYEENKVLAIEPDHYFTHYGFIPNPDGSLNYLGFGQLLLPINESVNSLINQMIDAGTLANAAGGFLGRGIKLRGGTWKFSPFEWKPVEVSGGSLRDNILPLPVREVSAVLFQLLTFLVQAGRDISSVQDIMTGDAKLASTMPVGTIMALVEQGLKVFTAIYKRIYRSLSEEFMKLYRLNSLYSDPARPYELAGEEVPSDLESDYSMTDLTVVPVADPNLSSDMQRMLKSQALEGLRGRPGVNEVEITRSSVHAIKPENENLILLTDDQISGKEPLAWTPPPNPQVIKAQANAQLLQARTQEVGIRLQMDIQEFQLKAEQMLADVELKRSSAMLNLAKVEEIGNSTALSVYQTELDRITSEAKTGLEMLKMKMQGMQGMKKGGQGNVTEQTDRDRPTRMEAMEGESSYSEGV